MDLSKDELKAFNQGKEAWDRYFNSGYYYTISWYVNFYDKETELNLWKCWNRGWNTNFKGIK